MSSFQCAECSARVTIPLKVKSVRCWYCGDANFVTDGVVRRAYPALHMYPVDYEHGHGADYPLSIWMLPHTRPVRVGLYDCRFQHTEPHVIRLVWTGATFVEPVSGDRVSMQKFLTWRGVMA